MNRTVNCAVTIDARVWHTKTPIRKRMNSKGDGKNCWRIGINYSKPKLALTKDKVNYW